MEKGKNHYNLDSIRSLANEKKRLEEEMKQIVSQKNKLDGDNNQIDNQINGLYNKPVMIKDNKKKKIIIKVALISMIALLAIFFGTVSLYISIKFPALVGKIIGSALITLFISFASTVLMSIYYPKEVRAIMGEINDLKREKKSNENEINLLKSRAFELVSLLVNNIEELGIKMSEINNKQLEMMIQSSLNPASVLEQDNSLDSKQPKDISELPEQVKRLHFVRQHNFTGILKK